MNALIHACVALQNEADANVLYLISDDFETINGLMNALPNLQMIVATSSKAVRENVSALGPDIKVKKIAEFPETLERASATREPHHLAYFALEVAALWNPYVQDGSRHRVLSDDAALTNARLGLTLGVRTVLANALGLLGVSAPERM